MKNDTRDYITRRPKEKMPTKAKLQLVAYLALMFFAAILYGTNLGYTLDGIWIATTYQVIMNSVKKK